VNVVTPPSNENTTARRRQDQLEKWDRALDWGVRDGDIEVHPHSPLAISDILTQSGGTLDLIPETITRPDIEIEPSDNVAAIRRSKSPKKRRSKANILTRHNLDDLYERCKKVQVLNALVKRPGEQRLYLAAGFLSWTTDEEGSKVRAPLLLFPTILTRKTGKKTGEGTSGERRYELRMDSSTPDLNLELIDVVADRWKARLPDYKAGQSLSLWYTDVAEAISEQQALSLEFDIAIGTAQPPQHINQLQDGTPWLPELPDKFDVALAMAITDNLDLSQLTKVMQLMGAPEENPHFWSSSDAANDNDSQIGQIHQLARRLADVGLERVEFRHLDDLPSRLHKWSDDARAALKSETIDVLDENGSLTALQLVRLSSMVELIDREPKEFKQFLHPHLAYHSTKPLFRRAHHQARLIEQELQDLQNHFHLERIPSKKQLLNLIEELGGSNVTEPDVVDADYFNARRQFMEFSVDKPANLTVEHRRLLSQLAKVLRFRELFVNNSEYRQALGPGYRGLQTNWAELESMISYANEISDHLESEALGARLLSQWQTCRKLYVDDFEDLQEAADSMRKMLRVLGTSHRHTEVEKLVTSASVLADNLRSWRAPEVDLSPFSSKSATDVLGCFSGSPTTDSATEATVAETEYRIRQHMQGRHTERQAVVDTLTWLLQASETAARQSLNIDAIVGRLNIA